MVRTHPWDDEEPDSNDLSDPEFPEPSDCDAHVAMIWDWLATEEPAALPPVSVTATPRPVLPVPPPDMPFDGTPESALRR